MTSVPASTGTVLLVDDDPEILEAMRDLLEMTFPMATILTAPDAASALDILDREAPMVIVSDYRMPGMDGVEFLQKSQRSAPAAVRLMMSAYADAGVAKRAVEQADVALLVTKPFQMDYFVQLIGSLLRKRAPEAPGR